MLYLYVLIYLNMTKKIYTKINHPELSVVNNETGEIVSGVAEIKTSSIDEFGFLFLKTLEPCVNLGATQLKVLLCCWMFSTLKEISGGISGNYFTNNADFKSFVRDTQNLDLSDNAINTSISRLKSCGIILATEAKGSYILNPKYFWKGKLSERSKLQLYISSNK